MGITLVLGGVGLLIQRTTRIAAAFAGMVLVLLTAGFYVPIAVTEMNSALALEGLNYVFDTMLFAGTILLAGRSAASEAISRPYPSAAREISAV